MLSPTSISQKKHICETCPDNEREASWWARNKSIFLSNFFFANHSNYSKKVLPMMMRSKTPWESPFEGPYGSCPWYNC